LGWGGNPAVTEITPNKKVKFNKKGDVFGATDGPHRSCDMIGKSWKSLDRRRAVAVSQQPTANSLKTSKQLGLSHHKEQYLYIV
jgi:hypothetical protein